MYPQYQTPQQPALNQGYPPAAAAPPQAQPQAPVQPNPGNTTTQESGSGWKTAAFWIGGVVASAVLVYLVNEAMQAGKRKLNEMRHANEEPPSLPPSVPEPKLYTLGTAEVDTVRELQQNYSTLAQQMEDVHNWISAQGERKMRGVR